MRKKNLEKVDFVKGSCFGYFDTEFIECVEKCGISAECKKATEAANVEQIRLVAKKTEQDVQNLVDEMKKQ